MSKWLLVATCLLVPLSVVVPAAVALSAKPLSINHSACWPGGLRTLADLGSNPRQQGGFSARLDWRACYEIKFSDRHSDSPL